EWAAGPGGTGPLGVGGRRAVDLLLGEGPGGTGEAEPDLPVAHNRAAARGVARRARERGRDRVAQDRVRSQRLLRRGASRKTAGEGDQACERTAPLSQKLRR